MVIHIGDRKVSNAYWASLNRFEQEEFSAEARRDREVAIAAEGVDARPTATLRTIVRNARATLARLADLEERRATWTEAERFEATYSRKRREAAYKKLNVAQAALKARGENS